MGVSSFAVSLYRFFYFILSDHCPVFLIIAVGRENRRDGRLYDKVRRDERKKEK